MTRTTTVKTADKVIYESTCTMNGNEVTGTVNPFPYIRRMLRKNGLSIVNMIETGNDIVLIVK